MGDKIVDFTVARESQLHKRKEARLEAMRQAFQRARGEVARPGGKNKKSRKSRK